MTKKHVKWCCFVSLTGNSYCDLFSKSIKTKITFRNLYWFLINNKKIMGSKIIDSSEVVNKKIERIEYAICKRYVYKK